MTTAGYSSEPPSFLRITRRARTALPLLGAAGLLGHLRPQLQIYTDVNVTFGGVPLTEGPSIVRITSSRQRGMSR